MKKKNRIDDRRRAGHYAVHRYRSPIAGNGYGDGEPQGTGEPQGRQDGSQDMDRIRDQIEECIENRAQIAALNAQLLELRTQTRTRLQEMRDNPDSVTDEQIEAARNIAAEMQTLRERLTATNQEMRQQRQTLRNVRRARNYEGIIAAYGDILRIQEQRITMLQQMVELHQQVCSL